jgi:hypothetical protein
MRIMGPPAIGMRLAGPSFFTMTVRHSAFIVRHDPEFRLARPFTPIIHGTVLAAVVRHFQHIDRERAREGLQRTPTRTRPTPGTLSRQAEASHGLQQSLA